MKQFQFILYILSYIKIQNWRSTQTSYISNNRFLWTISKQIAIHNRDKDNKITLIRKKNNRFYTFYTSVDFIHTSHFLPMCLNRALLSHTVSNDVYFLNKKFLWEGEMRQVEAKSKTHFRFYKGGWIYVRVDKYVLAEQHSRSAGQI